MVTRALLEEVTKTWADAWRMESWKATTSGSKRDVDMCLARATAIEECMLAVLHAASVGRPS